jgi:hypothetical protein
MFFSESATNFINEMIPLFATEEKVKLNIFVLYIFKIYGSGGTCNKIWTRERHLTYR